MHLVIEETDIPTVVETIARNRMDDDPVDGELDLVDTEHCARFRRDVDRPFDDLPLDEAEGVDDRPLRHVRDRDRDRISDLARDTLELRENLLLAATGRKLEIERRHERREGNAGEERVFADAHLVSSSTSKSQRDIACPHLGLAIGRADRGRQQWLSLEEVGRVDRAVKQCRDRRFVSRAPPVGHRGQTVRSLRRGTGIVLLDHRVANGQLRGVRGLDTDVTESDQSLLGDQRRRSTQGQGSARSVPYRQCVDRRRSALEYDTIAVVDNDVSQNGAGRSRLKHDSRPITAARRRSFHVVDRGHLDGIERRSDNRQDACLDPNPRARRELQLRARFDSELGTTANDHRLENLNDLLRTPSDRQVLRDLSRIGVTPRPRLDGNEKLVSDIEAHNGEEIRLRTVESRHEMVTGPDTEGRHRGEPVDRGKIAILDVERESVESTDACSVVDPRDRGRARIGSGTYAELGNRGWHVASDRQLDRRDVRRAIAGTVRGNDSEEVGRVELKTDELVAARVRGEARERRQSDDRCERILGKVNAERGQVGRRCVRVPVESCRLTRRRGQLEGHPCGRGRVEVERMGVRHELHLVPRRICSERNCDNHRAVHTRGEVDIRRLVGVVRVKRREPLTARGNDRIARAVRVESDAGLDRGIHRAPELDDEAIIADRRHRVELTALERRRLAADEKQPRCDRIDERQLCRVAHRVPGDIREEIRRIDDLITVDIETHGDLDDRLVEGRVPRDPIE